MLFYKSPGCDHTSLETSTRTQTEKEIIFRNILWHLQQKLVNFELQNKSTWLTREEWFLPFKKVV